jgi:very-short-patch-repair endonuclease
LVVRSFGLKKIYQDIKPTPTPPFQKGGERGEGKLEKYFYSFLIYKMHYNEIKEIARQLRKNPTDTEQILWEAIRKRKLRGCKFLRQHPIIYESDMNEHFFYIPDFYCAEKKLIVELDGKVHEYHVEKDIQRDQILKEKGIQILRIRNEELNDIEKVIEKIELMLYPPPSPPCWQGGE